jgi:RiboL-PSP-HEPN
MTGSASWRAFLGHLREITQLIRADPSSRYAERKNGGKQAANVDLTSAITKAAMSLTSGRLQGCLSSQVQEFLEHIDQSGMPVDQIPEVLRAHLVLRYPQRKSESSVNYAIRVQKANAELWQARSVVGVGSIITSSLSDAIWNPWPKKADELLGRCDIDLFSWIEERHGPRYLSELKSEVAKLVKFRNEVVHGDEPQPVGISEVWLCMRWSTRLARNADEALGAKLAELTGAPAW